MWSEMLALSSSRARGSFQAPSEGPSLAEQLAPSQGFVQRSEPCSGLPGRPVSRTFIKHKTLAPVRGCSSKVRANCHSARGHHGAGVTVLLLSDQYLKSLLTQSDFVLRTSTKRSELTARRNARPHPMTVQSVASSGDTPSANINS